MLQLVAKSLLPASTNMSNYLTTSYQAGKRRSFQTKSKLADMKKIISILTASLVTVLTQAQTQIHQYGTNTNAWIMYFGDHKLSAKWGIHLEAQLRRNDLFKSPQQMLLRTGINYHLNPNVFFTAGYCFVETYPYGAFPVKSRFPESRLWEQVQVKTQLHKIEWVSRFRAEQRFMKLPVKNAANILEPGDAVYNNRFRLLNRLSVPFQGETIYPGSFYVTIYDEMMVSTGKQVALNVFDQNRAYIALGYPVPNLGRLEFGYLLQNVYKPDGIRVEKNNTLQIGLASNINFYKKKNEHG
jgi:hypothetical protein